MEKKFNLVKILENCPTGMELDSPIWDGVVFDHIDIMKDTYPIYIKKMGGLKECLTENGYFDSDPGAKCVIFPKGKDTWEGFQRPFKDGDIVCNIRNDIIIYKKIDVKGYCGSFASLDYNNTFIPHYLAYLEDTCRFATEVEKQKLFDAIRANGYKWNFEKKTLEKLFIPKFKEGDRIVLKDNPHNMPSIRIKGVTDTLYILDEGFFYISSADEKYVLKDKFNINDLKIFDKVLVRDVDGYEWRVHFFSHYDNNKHRPYVCIGADGINEYKQCIPYEGNEHLLGNTDDCNEYFKTWEE